MPPESASSDFIYIDQLLEALSQLIGATTWPESRQGEFLDYVTRDVFEFGLAIREEAVAGRWTVAASLMRPLQERSEFVLAAAIDSEFPNKFIEYLELQIEDSFTGRPRKLVELARGKIRQWEKTIAKEDVLFKASKDLHSIGSEVQHHAIGLSRESEEVLNARPGLLKMMSGSVHIAVLNVVTATREIERNNTKAWLQASAIVSTLQ